MLALLRLSTQSENVTDREGKIISQTLWNHWSFRWTIYFTPFSSVDGWSLLLAGTLTDLLFWCLQDSPFLLLQILFVVLSLLKVGCALILLFFSLISASQNPGAVLLGPIHMTPPPLFLPICHSWVPLLSLAPSLGLGFTIQVPLGCLLGTCVSVFQPLDLKLIDDGTVNF